ncbi:uncharacterized protein M6B38_158610 [Iris pallida]|uniref:Omega-hydroxypalmitate O-feruloyl transferase n=1 Tax=Iris pallida TaxID=29817 RepID=A0AAX6F2A1_IRIPA|nr:uncharacterized protein M6B38_158605 [Iris pallida]KAJ6810268.1 uncharacterized protein M6B38_158610 [Iris pallida]
MTKSLEMPDCNYPKEAVLVRPGAATPRHSLYLSNLDDQPFLRFSIRYLYLYRTAVGVEALKSSLSRVLVDYYPLAGRLRASADDRGKLEVDCGEQGALFAEGHLDLTAAEFLEGSGRPNRSWRKLLYRVEAQSFLDVPPLVVQVIHLSCGGMLLCTAISHCLCDGIGTAQFLHAWAQATAKPNADPSVVVVPPPPFHSRRVLTPRSPPKIAFPHPEFSAPREPGLNVLEQVLLSPQPLAPVSVTFAPSQILRLKKQCVPSFKCTSFEVLAWHVWRCWVRSLDLPPALRVRLLFSTNVRRRLDPELPRGYYGNGFVLGCAEARVDRLVRSSARCGVKLVQQAKERVCDGYVRSVVDLLEERRGRKPDLSASLVISQWSKLGLEDLDFGGGRPLHMGPLASEIYCLFLPVVGDLHAFTVLVSVPQGCAERLEHLLRGEETNGGSWWHQK